jgi:FAD/FMN-containing dehydrogenase
MFENKFSSGASTLRASSELPTPEGEGMTAWANLRGRIDGTVVLPGEPGYDERRTLALGGSEDFPALIVVPHGVADVVRTVELAAETGMELAVRSGGHSIAGFGTTGGILLDVRGLTGLHVDLRQRTVRAGAGLTAGEVTAALAPHGLAVGFGDTASVGISGLTLGGGVGYLSRKHGLTVDSLIEAEIVTADGRVRRIDEDHDPELFWAIRGGGGNFGVVTELTFRLHEVGQFLGGLLILPASARTVAAFVRHAAEAPRELTTIANILLCPPLPFVPATAHGTPVIFATMAWTGDLAAAGDALRPFRSLAEPLADLLTPQPYAALFPAEKPRTPPHLALRTMFLDTVDEQWADRALTWVKAGHGHLRKVELRPLGGAVADVPIDATAYPHRDAPLMANVAVIFTDPHRRATHEDEVAGVAAALRQRRAGAYVNFLGKGGPARDAYPGATWYRLVRAKRRYDPANLFRGNHNTVPAPSPTGSAP